ncbi:hypothetical protein ACFW04_014164 [Cataglyphis niger]
MQQKIEVTNRLIKENVDIKNMAVEVTKLKKGSKGTMILDCETGEELEKLKAIVQAKPVKNFEVIESPQMKSKLKIVNIGEEEMKLSEDELIVTIKKYNKIVAKNEKIYMRIVKKIVKNQPERKGKEGSQKNIGQRKCLVYNHINIKRCFKRWGYYHIATNCRITRNETCHKCAGNHTMIECTATKKCVNCMLRFKHNLNISDEQDALDPKFPTFKRAIQKKKRTAG